MSPTEIKDWWDATAHTGDRFQLIYGASRIIHSSDLAPFKTVLSQRPDISVDSAALLSSYTLQAIVLELNGPQQLGPQLQRAVYVGEGAAATTYTLAQVIQVGGQNAITIFEAAVTKSVKAAGTTASNVAIVTTRDVKNALPSLGIGAAIVVPVLLFGGLYFLARGYRA